MIIKHNKHVSDLVSQPSQNRTSGFPTSGSSVGHSASLRSTKRAQVFVDPHARPAHPLEDWRECSPLVGATLALAVEPFHFLPSRLSDLCSWLDHSLHSGPVSSLMVNRPWEPSLRGHYPSSSLTVAVYRLPSLATRPSEHLLLHWWPYSGTALRLSPRALDRRSPGCLPAVVSLDAV